MGNFYTNITLKNASQGEVIKYLNTNRRSAYVSPTVDGSTVVYDEACENQVIDELSGLASALSKAAHAPALAILIHDDDVLWFQLHSDGRLMDEYNSEPNYFDAVADPAGPTGGDARKLCDAFDVDAVDTVESILRKSHAGVGDDPDAYVFEFERHADLVNALGLPAFAVGTGFFSFDANEIPDGIDMSNLAKTPQ